MFSKNIIKIFKNKLLHNRFTIHNNKIAVIYYYDINFNLLSVIVDEVTLKNVLSDSNNIYEIIAIQLYCVSSSSLSKSLGNGIYEQRIWNSSSSISNSSLSSLFIKDSDLSSNQISRKYIFRTLEYLDKIILVNFPPDSENSHNNIPFSKSTTICRSNIIKKNDKPNFSPHFSYANININNLNSYESKKDDLVTSSENLDSTNNLNNSSNSNSDSGNISNENYSISNNHFLYLSSMFSSQYSSTNNILPLVISPFSFNDFNSYTNNQQSQNVDQSYLGSIIVTSQYHQILQSVTEYYFNLYERKSNLNINFLSFYYMFNSLNQPFLLYMNKIVVLVQNNDMNFFQFREQLCFLKGFYPPYSLLLKLRTKLLPQISFYSLTSNMDSSSPNHPNEGNLNQSVLDTSLLRRNRSKSLTNLDPKTLNSNSNIPSLQNSFRYTLNNNLKDSHGELKKIINENNLLLNPEEDKYLVNKTKSCLYKELPYNNNICYGDYCLLNSTIKYCQELYQTRNKKNKYYDIVSLLNEENYSDINNIMRTFLKTSYSNPNITGRHISKSIPITSDFNKEIDSTQFGEEGDKIYRLPYKEILILRTELQYLYSNNNITKDDYLSTFLTSFKLKNNIDFKNFIQNFSVSHIKLLIKKCQSENLIFSITPLDSSITIINLIDAIYYNNIYKKIVSKTSCYKLYSTVSVCYNCYLLYQCVKNERENSILGNISLCKSIITSKNMNRKKILKKKINSESNDEKVKSIEETEIGKDKKKKIKNQQKLTSKALKKKQEELKKRFLFKFNIAIDFDDPSNEYTLSDYEYVEDKLVSYSSSPSLPFNYTSSTERKQGISKSSNLNSESELLGLSSKESKLKDFIKTNIKYLRVTHDEIERKQQERINNLKSSIRSIQEVKLSREMKDNIDKAPFNTTSPPSSPPHPTFLPEENSNYPSNSNELFNHIFSSPISNKYSQSSYPEIVSDPNSKNIQYSILKKDGSSSKFGYEKLQGDHQVCFDNTLTFH